MGGAQTRTTIWACRSRAPSGATLSTPAWSTPTRVAATVNTAACRRSCSLGLVCCCQADGSGCGACRRRDAGAGQLRGRARHAAGQGDPRTATASWRRNGRLSVGVLGAARLGLAAERGLRHVLQRQPRPRGPSRTASAWLRFPDRKAAERMLAWVQVLPGFFEAGVTAEQRRSRAALGQQRRAPPRRPAPAEHFSVLSRSRHRSGNVARRVVQLCVLGGRAVHGRRARAHLLPEAPARSVRPDHTRLGRRNPRAPGHAILRRWLPCGLGRGAVGVGGSAAAAGWRRRRRG